MRKFVLISATLLLLAAPGAARGDGPEVTTSVTSSSAVAPSISATCGFNVIETITVYVRTLIFRDSNGVVTHAISHIEVDGSYTKEATGEALPARAVWTQILDVAEATRTITGLRLSVQAAGEPPSAVMVGRLVIPAPPGGIDPIETTPAMGSFPELWTEICASFSS
jgi:hypothetical protein